MNTTQCAPIPSNSEFACTCIACCACFLYTSPVCCSSTDAHTYRAFVYIGTTWHRFDADCERNINTVVVHRRRRHRKIGINVFGVYFNDRRSTFGSHYLCPRAAPTHTLTAHADLACRQCAHTFHSNSKQSQSIINNNYNIINDFLERFQVKSVCFVSFFVSIAFRGIVIVSIVK